jgi:hypothetical protein
MLFFSLMFSLNIRSKLMFDLDPHMSGAGSVQSIDLGLPRTASQSYTRYCRHPISGFPVPAAGAGTRSPHVGCRQRAVDLPRTASQSYTIDTAGILSLVFQCRQPVPALDPHMSGAGSVQSIYHERPVSRTL